MRDCPGRVVIKGADLGVGQRNQQTGQSLDLPVDRLDFPIVLACLSGIAAIGKATDGHGQPICSLNEDTQVQSIAGHVLQIGQRLQDVGDHRLEVHGQQGHSSRAATQR